MSNSNWKIFFLGGDGNGSCERVQEGSGEQSSSQYFLTVSMFCSSMLQSMLHMRKTGGLPEMGGFRLSPSHRGS